MIRKDTCLNSETSKNPSSNQLMLPKSLQDVACWVQPDLCWPSPLFTQTCPPCRCKVVVWSASCWTGPSGNWRHSEKVWHCLAHDQKRHMTPVEGQHGISIHQLSQGSSLPKLKPQKYPRLPLHIQKLNVGTEKYILDAAGHSLWNLLRL